jgi:uncharacterized membrane protein YdjX (TVP38/TMEM64 family)
MMYQLLLQIRRWSLLGFLILMFVLFYYFRLHYYLTFEAMKAYQYTLKAWTLAHYVSAVFLYIVIFILIIACGIPGATFLALAGGFLFGTSAIFYAILGTTLGGLTLFFAIRTTLGAQIAAKSSGWIKTMELGFQENAFLYLLMLRLMPVFPCWISNISAGALNVPVRTFLFATVLGITPATIIYVYVGRGFDQFFASEHVPSLSFFLTPSIVLPLIGLAILSALPVFYKSIRKYYRNR